MEVGDLVRYKDDNDIGVIMWIGTTKLSYYIQWADGTDGFHIASEFEVINESG